MFKFFSMLVVAGALVVAGDRSAIAANTKAPAARAPATAARPGTQTIRRYSAAPGTYRAPAMRSYRSNSSSGPSWTATRKILGY